MWWNLEDEKMDRAAAFITDWSRDGRCDGMPACVFACVVFKLRSLRIHLR